MTAKPETKPAGYRIGAVSKLTGISPDTLRIWERRYAAVTPERSAAGGRLYASEDVDRLRLMKVLVDAGDSIGAVAALSHEALLARATAATPVAAPAATRAPCRLAVIGGPLALKLQATRDVLTDIDPVASYTDAQAFDSDAGGIEVDVLLVEQPTLQAETALQLVDRMARVKAAYAIVVYGFAARDTLQQLPRSRCTTLRAPVDAQTIQNHCVALMGRRASAAANEPALALAAGEPAPPRRYDDETLARLATLSSTVKCECPRHLAELIASLCAFETYSGECESRSPKDAALHAFLHATTSRARHMIEAALGQVIEAENIKL